MSPDAILKASGVSHQPFAGWRGVVISRANQLLGPFRSIKNGQETDSAYLGWEAHHVVECRDLERLNIVGRFPPRELQLCVLIPSIAHRERINQILQSANPRAMKVTVEDLLPAYRTAYSVLGNYSGGGEAAIQRELMGIVEATLR